MVRREWAERKEVNELKEQGLLDQLEIKAHDRYFITSHDIERARATALDVRTHWSVENKNHRKKDTSLWREDDHRHRRVNVAQNLALMRSALLAIIPFDDKQNLDDYLSLYDDQPSQAIRRIQNSLPI